MNTHKSNPNTNLLQASLQGNMGSQTLFRKESILSHPMKAIQKNPDKTKDAIMGALCHGYSTPACSRPKTNRMEAANEANAPKKSTRLHACSDISVLKKRAGPG
jgi:hypothetical protein